MTTTRTAPVHRGASLGLLMLTVGALGIAGSGIASAGGAIDTIDHVTISKVSPDGTPLSGAQFGVYLPGGNAAEGLGATGFGSSSDAATADAAAHGRGTVPDPADVKAAQAKTSAAQAAYDQLFGSKSATYLAAGARSAQTETAVAAAMKAAAALGDTSLTPAQKAAQQKIQDTHDAAYAAAGAVFDKAEAAVQATASAAEAAAQATHNKTTSDAYAIFNNPNSAALVDAAAKLDAAKAAASKALQDAGDALAATDAQASVDMAAAKTQAETDLKAASGKLNGELNAGTITQDSYNQQMSAAVAAYDAANAAADAAYTTTFDAADATYQAAKPVADAANAAADAAYQKARDDIGDTYNQAVHDADVALGAASAAAAAKLAAANQIDKAKEDGAVTAADKVFANQNAIFDASVKAGRSGAQRAADAKVTAAKAAAAAAKGAQNTLEVDFLQPSSAAAKTSSEGRALISAQAAYRTVKTAADGAGWAAIGKTQRGTITSGSHGSGSGYADIYSQVANGDSGGGLPTTMIRLVETKAPAGYKTIAPLSLTFNRASEKWNLVDPGAHPGITVTTSGAVHDGAGLLRSIDVGVKVTDPSVDGPTPATPVTPAQPADPAPAKPAPVPPVAPVQPAGPAPVAPAPVVSSTPAAPAVAPPTHISAGGANPTANPAAAAGGVLAMIAGLGSIVGIHLKRRISAR